LPEKKEKRKLIVKYSRAFKGYNANVKYNMQQIEFRLSHEWKEVSDEITIGLIQLLFLKIYKQKKKTVNIDLYNAFVKKLATYSPTTEKDPELEESFKRVNKEYFNEMMDQPNLVWGGSSYSKLGSYEYTTNTITISNIFQHHSELLDYIMYHELLHKKLKFYNKNGRSFHHTTKFRQLEKQFKNPNIEKDLEKFLKRHRLLKMFRFW
jgi:predicted SprT family Zn-dependent metalloprotease